MAEMVLRIVLLGLLINILFITAFVNGLARRGGRGGSSRSFRTSSVRSTRIKVHHNVALSGRIVRGSSTYTASTWFLAFQAGRIYGGSRHMNLNRNKMPTICTNKYEKRPDGLVYGYFICPKESDFGDEIYCCGPEDWEYCCNKTVAELYYTKHYYVRSSGPSIGSIIGTVIAAVVLIAVAAYCCRKRKHAGAIIRRFSKRGGRTTHDYRGPQAVPLNSENPNGESTVISQAPPSYTAATAVGYDGSQAYPYSNPQQYPSQPFPPGAPQPYPPYTMTEDKSGPQPPEIYPGSPYKPYTTDGQAPYSTMPNGSDQPPYPPPSGEPFFPPASGAPYPLPSGAPYPPPGDAPYPPPSGTPYPYSAPYPTSSPGVAPYPVNPDLPYPQPVAQNYGAPPYPTPEAGDSGHPPGAGDNPDKITASAPPPGNTYA